MVCTVQTAATLRLTSLPLGLMCLIPPASVSDACDNLVKQMNKLRSFETIDDPWKTNADQFFNVDRHTFTQKKIQLLVHPFEFASKNFFGTTFWAL